MPIKQACCLGLAIKNPDQLSLRQGFDAFVSGQQDSNLRPPGPKPGALTGLRYAPINYWLAKVNFILTSHIYTHKK